MSKLFKSKFLLGVMTVALMVVGVASYAAPAAADCSISHTLRIGSTGTEVVCLQTALGGLTPDGSFGPKTKAAVVAWQAKEGLTPDGVFGPKSNAVWMANQSNVGVFPAGCTSAVGFSSTTGMSCAGGVSGFPAGCTSAVGFSPTTGMSCAVSSSLPAGCTSTAGFSPTTGMSCAGAGPVIGGGAGNITSTTLNGSPSNVQVGEGASAVAVLGFQVRADAGSNLNIQNVRVNLLATGTGSTWPSRYINNISVWQGATKVGSVAVSQLSQNGTTYTATIPLTGATVAANTTSNFAIAVDTNTSIDTGDAGNVFNVSVDSIRYSDQTGAILTTSLTGIVQPMRFIKLSSSASTKLVLSEDAGNPKDHTVVTNYTSITNDVSLLKFNLAAQGSDMIITKIALPATATLTTNASDISAYYKLKYNGSVVSSFTLTATGLTPTITFGDTSITGSTAMNGGVGQIVIKSGTTGAFEVVADVKAMNTDAITNAACTGTNVPYNGCTGVGTGTVTLAGNFTQGDTLKVDFPSATLQSTAVSVQDQTGASLGTSSTNRTGSATGYNATFRVEGISTAFVGATLAPTLNNTTGALTSEQYVVKVAVTAVGNDFFIPTSAAIVAGANTTTVPALGSPTAGISFVVSNGAGQYQDGTTGSGHLVAGAVSTSVDTTGLNIDGASGRIKVSSGTTVTIPFTVTITETGTAGDVAGQYKVSVLSVNGANSGVGALTPFATTPITSYQSQFNTPAFQ